MSSSARGGTICKVQLIFKAKQAVITVTVCFLFIMLDNCDKNDYNDKKEHITVSYTHLM